VLISKAPKADACLSNIQREDEEAAKLYEEFVESFEADDKKPKAFVRGGIIDPSKRVGHEAEGARRLSL
jgi:U2-associated protein SR140